MIIFFPRATVGEGSPYGCAKGELCALGGGTSQVMFGSETANEGSSAERHREETRVISSSLSILKKTKEQAHELDLKPKCPEKVKRIPPPPLQPTPGEMRPAARWIFLIPLGLMVQGRTSHARLVSVTLR